MNAAHYHLMINHAPIFGTIFGILIFIWGMIRKNLPIKKVAVYLLIISTVAAIIAAQTGDGAEEIAEHIPAVSRHQIHEHEEAADTSMWFMYAMAFAGLGWLVALNKEASYEKYLQYAILALALASAVSLAYTGYEGGLIRHPEISSTAKIPDGD